MTVGDEVIEYMKIKLGGGFLGAEVSGERRISIKITPSALRDAVKAMKEKYPELRFITISTVDHGLDFEFLHHFSIDGSVVTLRSLVPKEDGTLQSIVDIIPAASLIEREISDLFGVKVLNHPNMRNLILTEDWPDNKRPLKKPFETDLPKKIRPVAEALISKSCVASISTFIQRRRVDGGLPKTPPFAFADEEDLEEFHGIIKDTGLDRKVGFDWERKSLRYK